MKTLKLTAIRCSLMFLVPALAYAGSAEWNLKPTSDHWNTAANWTPMTVPNGPADTAAFALSNTTDVSISADTEVNGIMFTPPATSPYFITVSRGITLTLSGTGVTNSSGIVQNFVTNGDQFGQISFTNNATAGSSTIFINNHGKDISQGGHTFFFNTSTAGNATFINNSGVVGGPFQGFTEFFDTSTAGNGTFINVGSTTIGTSNGGGMGFLDSASAGEATITNNIGCSIYFTNSSTAASATIINNGGTVSGERGGVIIIGLDESDTATAASATLNANGGTGGGRGGRILFLGNSTGGTSRIEVSGDGSLDISGHNAPGMTIGSIEGDGDVFLGAHNLTLGSNDLNTTFSGVIADGGFGALLTKLVSATKTHTDDRDVFKIYESISRDRFVFQDGGVGGSLTKIGKGSLILSGTNTYTGNTNVEDGVLQVDGSITSNTVVGHRGTLSGSGTILGNLTNSSGGEVIPGDVSGLPGALTVGGNYDAQRPVATLSIQVGGAAAGQVSVLDVQGNANLNGFIDPVLVNGFVPEIGQSFTFMNYASFTGYFSHIKNPVFDHGRKRWLVAYNPTSAVLTVIGNGHGH